jgi:hypothetical protein
MKHYLYALPFADEQINRKEIGGEYQRSILELKKKIN